MEEIYYIILFHFPYSKENRYKDPLPTVIGQRAESKISGGSWHEPHALF
jgi:hypothetical protein